MPRSGHTRWAALAGCLAAAFGLWQAWYVAAAPFPVRYDFDEGVYAETAAAAAGGARLYSDAFLSQPPGLIMALRAAYHLGGETLPSGRRVPLFAALLWLGALFSILAGAGRPRAGLLAVCAAAGNAGFVAAAHTVQMEAPSEALAALSVALAVTGSRGRTAAWVASGVALGLAALMKFTALVVLVPLSALVAVALARVRGETEGVPAWWRPPVAVALGAVASVLPFLPTIFEPRFIADTVVYHLAAARTAAVSPAANLVAVWRFLTASWPVTAAAAFGVFAAWAPTAASHSRPLTSSAWRPWIAVAWLVAEGAALAAMAPLWPHHLVLLLSPLALLAGIGVDAGIDVACARAGWVAAAAVGLSVCVYLASAVSAAAPPSRSDALRRAAETIARDVPSTGAVVTDDPIVPFVAGRRVPPDLIDTSEVRIRSRALPEAAVSAALARPEVQAVLLWRGTFARLYPQAVARADAEFTVSGFAEGDRRLLLRRAPQASGGHVADAR